jgi:hypothetical protein
MKNVKTSKSYMAIIDAVEKGYRPTPSGAIISPRGKVLATRKIGKGRIYSAFSFTFEGKRVALKVSSFICYYYDKSGYSKKGSVARHLNDNPNDNRPVNIAAGTVAQNMADRIRNRNMKKRASWIVEVQKHPLLEGFAVCV